jgi:hypothetical protein
MAEDPNESRAREFLIGRGFRVERFGKAETRVGKTPDFHVYQGDAFRFYCEVKGVDPDRWLDRLLDNAPPGQIVGGGRQDPVFNRLTGDIHQAVKQFDAVNPDLHHANVLIFVNNPGSNCGYGDLLSALTGQFFADSGERFPIYTVYSEGRIKHEKLRVHLYIWLEPDGKAYKFFPGLIRQHERDLCLWFGKDPSDIPRLDA